MQAEPAGPRGAIPPVRILGIDPGSRATGFGVIESRPSGSRCVVQGVLEPPEAALPERLLHLFQRLCALIRETGPHEVALEQVFVRHNVASALILGQARGVALCAAAEARLPVHEYAPARIKLAVSGSGRADKPQVQQMVKMLLNLRTAPAPDAADALACALCHAHSRKFQQNTARSLQGARR